MIKNYLLVAFRQLKRQPAYTALNILGLTIGTISCLIIVLYLHHEVSYDDYHDNASNIYRIGSRISEPDDSFNWATTQHPLGPTATEELSEVAQYARFIPTGRLAFRKGDISYFIEDCYTVDSTIFEVFTFDFIAGDPQTALDAPNSIALSQLEAEKIFKGEDPMGQILETENSSYTVRGVYKDQPNTSHLIARAMTSLSTNQRVINNQQWGGFNIYTYVVLEDFADPEEVRSKLNTQINEKYVATIFDQFDIKIDYDLINIRDIHLKSDFEGEPTPLGNQDYIYIFGVVAVFMVLIACINYMNLATARSVRRSLEVGIRKVMGARRYSLIGQFLAESVIVAFISLVLSILLLLILVPLINQQLNTQLDPGLLLSPQIALTVVGLLIFTGLASGVYPAFYLSAYAPVQAIRGGVSGLSGKTWIRRVLVGIQFSISIFMLIGTFIIYDQMQYVRNSDLGFDKEQVITFTLDETGRQKWLAMKNQLRQNPGISNLATATSIPGNGYPKNLLQVEQNSGVMEEYGVNLYGVDYEYFETLDIPIIEGRNFSRDFATDTSNAVMINESMVKRLAWDDPIGKRISPGFGDSTILRVVGVVKDFHQLSLHNPIEPLLFHPELPSGNNVLIKIGGDIPQTVRSIESTWNEFLPNTPFEYSFLDQGFQEAYEDDQLRGRLFLGFAAMMIIISSLGLLGLASFIAEQRTKEISIRKVLGAETGGLVTLLVKDFVWLVLIGAIPAFIVGYRIMDNWLQSFEYHVNVNFLLFAVVLLIVLMVTILTTGYHAYRAAVSNPADNLKCE